MKLPSLALAVTAAQQTFWRFPVIVLDAIVGTIVALILIDYEGPAGPTLLFQVLAATIIGFPLLVGLALVAEKRRWSYGIALGMQGGGVVLTALYTLTVPQDLLSAPAFHVIRLALLSAGLVLFAFSVPFLGHESERGYWNFAGRSFSGL